MAKKQKHVNRLVKIESYTTRSNRPVVITDPKSELLTEALRQKGYSIKTINLLGISNGYHPPKI